jgi:hypothetical protein
MGWGTVELEPEVLDWLSELDDEGFGQVGDTSACSPTKASISASRSPDSSTESYASSGSISTDERFASPTTSPPAAGSSC